MTTETLPERAGGSGLALTDDQAWWNDRQKSALSQLGVRNANQGDLLVFMHVAQKTGLDPFSRQIYMIERAGKQTIQTGIDGFRLVARRAADRLGETLEYGDTLWCGDNGQWHDVWLGAGAPAAAKSTVIRNGKRFTAVALFREYAQLNRDGNPVAMWAKMPANQLAKCAEALVLRKAYPQDLSALYTDDEMGQADRGDRRAPAANAGSGRQRMASVLGAEPAPADEVEPSDVVDGEVVEEPDTDAPRLDLRSQMAKKMFAVMGEAGIPDDRQHEYLTRVLGREITTRKDLTEADAHVVIEATVDALEHPYDDEPGQDGGQS